MGGRPGGVGGVSGGKGGTTGDVGIKHGGRGGGIGGLGGFGGGLGTSTSKPDEIATKSQSNMISTIFTFGAPLMVAISSHETRDNEVEIEQKKGTLSVLGVPPATFPD